MKHLMSFILGNFVLLSVFAQTNVSVLKVEGTAIAKQKPEIIAITINLVTEEMNYFHCHEISMKKLQKTKIIFIDNGFKESDIKTKEIRIEEKRIYKEGTAQFDGYKGLILLEIQELYTNDVVNKLMNSLNHDSAEFVYNISFKLSEEQKEKLRENTIKISIEDARKKAQIIAESSNLELIKIKEISYNFNTYGGYGVDNDLITEYTWVDHVRVGSSSAMKTSLDLNPKEVSLRKSIQIIYEVRSK